MKAGLVVFLVVLGLMGVAGYAKDVGVTPPDSFEIPEEPRDPKEDAILGPMELREPTLYTGFPTVTKRFHWKREQAEKISELCKAWRKHKEQELAAQNFGPIFSECRLHHRQGTVEFYYEAYIVFQPQPRQSPGGLKDENLVVSVPVK